MNSDIDLLHRVSIGEKNAFRELYQQFSDRVYNTAISFAQNPSDAKDIAQEVFIKIHKNAGKFKRKSSLNTWIYRITVNTAINHINKRKRLKTNELNDSNNRQLDFSHPGILLEQKEKAQALFKAIKTLPDHQKTAFILSFVEGLPRQEVADIMNKTLKSIEALLMRAKSNLRQQLSSIYEAK